MEMRTPMPELCYIYTPIYRTCSNQEYAAFRRHNIWDLTRRKIMYGVDRDENLFTVKLDGGILMAEKLYDLKVAVEIIAKRNGAFTDYREARAFIARKNA